MQLRSPRVLAVLATASLATGFLGSAIMLLSPLPSLAQMPAGSWSEATPMPTARSELAVAALDGKIYAAGGFAQFGPTTAFQRFDPKANAWDKLADLPNSLHHLGLAAADRKVFATGGYTGITFTPDQSATWAYDPKIAAWTRAADMPSPRAAHAMAALDGKLYVVGGVGPDPQALWAYDPKTDSWDTDLAPLPTAREHLAAVAHDGKLYVIGGRREEIGNLATLEIYDPATDSWRRGPDMPTPRGGITAGVIQGRIHVTGGEAFSPRQTFDRHEVYDPQADAWWTANPLPTARHGLASAVIDDRWYVIGGGEKAGALTIISLTDTVEVFAPAKRAGVRRCCS